MLGPQILEILLRWQHLGVDDDGDGTRLIAKVPHVAPLARLHATYAPLDETAIAGLESDLNFYFPKDLRDFYAFSNGLYTFSGSISIFGRRGNYSREPDAALRQPFDILRKNLRDRPDRLASAKLTIGFYKEDGSEAVLDRSGRISRCDRNDDTQILGTWNSFSEWLVSELERVAQFYDEEGRRTVDGRLIFGPRHQLN